ncbi:head-tail adaptor [Ralstonia phage RSB1]|uniref:Head portal-like protein n=1 Tax=Ralstonia phage RSB1 TaxID=551790 RepID=B5BTW6_9CAUD|nr:head-tail adaptor [Ralstonia phage RSB1]BAG70388.1 head portal-like protein [Ralstonia phage RSB1]
MSNPYDSPKACWTALDGRANTVIRRSERYASWTQPSLCPPDGFNEQTELQNDYQSVGSECVNSLSNRLVLNLFAPSRPFMRYDVPPAIAAKLDIDPAVLQTQLSKAERDSVKLLDQLSTRPKLFEAIKHLIVIGNVLVILGKDKTTPLRTVPIKKFRCKRSPSGKLVTLAIKECLKFDELDEKVQQKLLEQSPTKYQFTPNNPPDCEWYTEVCLQPDGRYAVRTQVDDAMLTGHGYDAMYTEEEMPYRVLTWELPDGWHYGIGLVEQHAGDFAAISTMSASQLQSAILASEFRWLVNPAGITQPEDMVNSQNGDVVPGSPDDVVAVTAATAGVASALQVQDLILSKYVTRVGRAFLLASAAQRDAERVTAEEIRRDVLELETSLGGVYSRLAVDFQKPLAYWLARMLGVKLSDTGIQPTIITGLDALSRNSDLENLMRALQQLLIVSQIVAGGGPLSVTLNTTSIAASIFAGNGVDADTYVNDQETQQALMEQEQARQESLAAAPNRARNQQGA